MAWRYMEPLVGQSSGSVSNTTGLTCAELAVKRLIWSCQFKSSLHQPTSWLFILFFYSPTDRKHPHRHLSPLQLELTNALAVHRPQWASSNGLFYPYNLSGGSWTWLLYFSPQYFYKISFFSRVRKVEPVFWWGWNSADNSPRLLFSSVLRTSETTFQWFFLSGAHKRLNKYPSCSSPCSPGTCGYDASMFLQERLVVPAPPVSFSLSFPATALLGGSCHIVSLSSRCSPSAVIFLPLRQHY